MKIVFKEKTKLSKKTIRNLKKNRRNAKHRKKNNDKRYSNYKQSFEDYTLIHIGFRQRMIRERERKKRLYKANPNMKKKVEQYRSETKRVTDNFEKYYCNSDNGESNESNDKTTNNAVVTELQKKKTFQVRFEEDCMREGRKCDKFYWETDDRNYYEKGTTFLTSRMKFNFLKHFKNGDDDMHQKMLKLLLDAKLRLSSRELPSKAYSQFRRKNKDYDWFEEDFYIKHNSVSYNHVKTILYKCIFNVGKHSKADLKRLPFKPPKHECHVFDHSNNGTKLQWCLCTKKIPLLHGTYDNESDDEDINVDDFLGPVNSADELENESEDEVQDDGEEMNPEIVYEKGDIRCFFKKKNIQNQNYTAKTSIQDVEKEHENERASDDNELDDGLDKHGFYEEEFYTGF